MVALLNNLDVLEDTLEEDMSGLWEAKVSLFFILSCIPTHTIAEILLSQASELKGRLNPSILYFNSRSAS